MLVVSSREFREKQAEYMMDRADNGEQIIVQRGKNKAYALTPVTDDDLYFNTKMLTRIKQSMVPFQTCKLFPQFCSCYLNAFARYSFWIVMILFAYQ